MPGPEVEAPPPVKKPETEADREKRRVAARRALVPVGTNCLPAAVRAAAGAATLELGAVDGQPVVCAIGADPELLLGPIACWTIDLTSGALTYRAAAPLPGRGFPVKLDGRCARGYCLPDGAALPTPPVVHLAWSHGGDKVVVAIPGEAPEIHVFDAAAKAHLATIAPRDAAHAARALITGLAGVVVVGDVIGAIGSAGATGAPVFMFKTDGSPLGAIERLGGKLKGPVSVARGSVSVFGAGQLALNEDAMTTLTTIEVATGKRAKMVRKPPKTACKPKDLAALIAGTATKASERCRREFDAAYEPLRGALVASGNKTTIVLLRGAREGELAIVHAKTLEETGSLAAQWCGPDGKPRAAAAPAEE